MSGAKTGDFSGFHRRRDQLPDCIKDNFELLIVLSLKLFDFLCQVFMGSDHFSQFGKCAHNLNIDLNGHLAVQNAGKHGHPLFGEGIGRIGGVF